MKRFLTTLALAGVGALVALMTPQQAEAVPSFAKLSASVPQFMTSEVSSSLSFLSQIDPIPKQNDASIVQQVPVQANAAGPSCSTDASHGCSVSFGFCTATSGSCSSGNSGYFCSSFVSGSCSAKSGQQCSSYSAGSQCSVVSGQGGSCTTTRSNPGSCSTQGGGTCSVISNGMVVVQTCSGGSD